jgi:hypothetical protein
MDFPEPLFESHLHERKACLVCGARRAATVLRTTGREIVPICPDCSTDWNFVGYAILKRIKPRRLLRSLALFKLSHPFQKPSWRTILRDLRVLQDWARNMRRWMKDSTPV